LKYFFPKFDIISKQDICRDLFDDISHFQDKCLLMQQGSLPALFCC